MLRLALLVLVAVVMGGCHSPNMFVRTYEPNDPAVKYPPTTEVRLHYFTTSERADLNRRVGNLADAGGSPNDIAAMKLKAFGIDADPSRVKWLGHCAFLNDWEVVPDSPITFEFGKTIGATDVVLTTNAGGMDSSMQIKNNPQRSNAWGTMSGPYWGRAGMWGIYAEYFRVEVPNEQ